MYPTQKKTYAGLQKIEGHEHDCGRPGINGGYISNKNVRLGVNCYGVKPKMSKEEEENMKNVTPFPKTKKEKQMEKRVNAWKKNLDEIMVNPFNYDKWNE